MSSLPKKTDPRIDRTRKAVEDAFLSVMEAKGFEDLTVNDVAEKAGINRVTFYAHFEDKYALLGHEIRRMFSDALSESGLGERSWSAAAVRDLFVTICRHVSAVYEHCRPPHVHLNWVMEAQITSLSSELMQTWAGHSRADLSLETTAASSAMYGLVRVWMAQRNALTAEAFVDQSLSIVTDIVNLSN